MKYEYDFYRSEKKEEHEKEMFQQANELLQKFMCGKKIVETEKNSYAMEFIGKIKLQKRYRE